MKFYNRDTEIAILHENEQQAVRNSATFTVLMGRRRVGKTPISFLRGAT